MIQTLQTPLLTLITPMWLFEKPYPNLYHTKNNLNHLRLFYGRFTYELVLQHQTPATKLLQHSEDFNNESWFQGDWMREISSNLDLKYEVFFSLKLRLNENNNTTTLGLDSLHPRYIYESMRSSPIRILKRWEIWNFISIHLSKKSSDYQVNFFIMNLLEPGNKLKAGALSQCWFFKFAQAWGRAIRQLNISVKSCIICSS